MTAYKINKNNLNTYTYNYFLILKSKKIKENILKKHIK